MKKENEEETFKIEYEELMSSSISKKAYLNREKFLMQGSVLHRVSSCTICS